MSLLSWKRSCPPVPLGVRDGRLAACPDRPNCVTSDAPAGSASHVVPLRLVGDPAQSWDALRDAIARRPRTRIVASDDRYLHAECRTRLLGFVDDLELLRQAFGGTVAVRSASRVGRSDLGANRRRVEALRRDLAGAGLVEG